MENQVIFLASNIKKLRLRQKLSQEDLAGTLEIGRMKLHLIETGKTVNPPLEDVIKFSTFFNISTDVLLKTDLRKVSELTIREMEAGDEAFAIGTKIRVIATTVDQKNRDNIELVPIKAKAGYASGYGDPAYIGKLPAFHMPTLPRDRKYRMFPITGDSMLPIPDSAYVMAHYIEDWKGIKSGTPCIVITQREGIIFKLVTCLPKALQLVSNNPLYAPYEVSYQEVLEVWQFHSYMSNEFPGGDITLNLMASSLQEMRVSMAKIAAKV